MEGLERREAPIGVFDSGVGGLTVVQKLFEVLPNETLLYVADQAHVPYGGRDLSEIRGFAAEISRALFDGGCKAVVMACNISSAAALESVVKAHPGSPVAGVILYGAEEAAQRTQNGRVGVLTTEGTKRSGAYTRALTSASRRVQVTEVGCPRFVPLVEAGLSESEEANEAAREYLAPILAAEADTVILGCTHYPYLLPMLRRIAPHLSFVDPAEATANGIASRLSQCDLLSEASLPAPSLLTTTGELAFFRCKAPQFLGVTPPLRFALSQWNGERLSLPLPVALEQN